MNVGGGGGGGVRTLTGETTNHIGAEGMLLRESFGFLELGNAISCLLTRAFELICPAEILFCNNMIHK